MPELPEVEYASRVLRAAVVGRTIGKVTVLHPSQRRQLPPRDVARLVGTTISTVERRGKHQLIGLSSGDTLVVHFRMTGDWLVDSITDDVPRFARVVVELTDGSKNEEREPDALYEWRPA